MFIVYATNQDILAQREDLVKKYAEHGRVVFRNASAYNGEVEKCSGIAVLGEFPVIVANYEANDIPVVADVLPVLETTPAPKRRSKTTTE